MAGVNKVILIGNLGKDPEVRYLEGGIAVANFPIATTETFRDKNGGKKEQTEWHQVVMWRRLAEVSEKYLRKGQQVYIEGKIRSRSWADKDGNKRYTTEIFGDVLTILSRPQSSEQEPDHTESTSKESEEQKKYNTNSNNDQNPPAPIPPSEDGLPF